MKCPRAIRRLDRSCGWSADFWRKLITGPPRVVLLPALCALLGACSQPAEDVEVSSESAEAGLDDIAARYVRLALAFGEHDTAYVDAYFGPDEWSTDAVSRAASLDALRSETGELAAALEAVDTTRMEEIQRLRHSVLTKRIDSMWLRMQMADGRLLDFDEESAILFDAVAPDLGAGDFEAILEEIDALIPGDAPLPERVESFRQNFVIPKDRLKAVFDAAIAECRRRTLEHIDLPPDESFEIEYVTDQPWSGYNWYKGDFFSLIQINIDLPIFIGRAVDLGCHEGYPGHHTYNVLLERDLVDGRGWMEFTLNPLYGPQSLISEGSANYGIEVAFPAGERARFEREALFPLAGLDASEAERYYRLAELLDMLSYAGNEAARDYLNGDISAAEAARWLVTYTLSAPERAEQRVRFFDTYRSYVINYNLGKDLVREYVERRAGDDPGARWMEFARVLSLPMTPADLRD